MAQTPAGPQPLKLETIEAQVEALLSALSGEDVGPQTRLKEDLALDSLELVQVVLQVNQRFAIRILSHEILPAHFGTAAQLAALVHQKQVEAQHAN